MKKKFDAVNFQRKVRDELGKKYLSNRKSFLQELKDICNCSQIAKKKALSSR
jgi:hypothetical protein